MSEDNTEITKNAETPKAGNEQAGEVRENKYEKRQNKPGRDRNRGDRNRNRQANDEFDSRIINIRRVSRMFKGGRRLRMSVFVVAGDKKGRVGIGLGKGADVAQAQAKAAENAKRNLVMVPIKGNTIPHEVLHKYRSSKIMLKPAAPGTGLVAGATVKAVLELAGVKDVLSKNLGSTNQINAAYATIEALQSLRMTRL